MKHAELPPTADHPILLPTEHEFTVLVIHDLHRQMQHVGTSHTLSQLRRKYWIPRGRQAVKKAIAQCRTCRRHQGPCISDATIARHAAGASHSFTTLYIHCGGLLRPPLLYRPARQRKVLVALYTCLAIRAVHLELATDLSAEQFLLTLRRFIARRVTPKQILSDNAPQFQVADQMLQPLWSTAINQTCVQSYMSDHLAIYSGARTVDGWCLRTLGQNGVYSLKWRLTDRYLRWGTLAGPRPGRADANQCKSSDFLQELRISGFPRF